MIRLFALALRRLALGLAVVIGVATASFLLARALPGDPARMLVGPQASAADVARARAIHALDQPLRVQYVRYLSRLVHLSHEGRTREHRGCAVVFRRMHVDLGYSFSHGRPVVDLVLARAPRSIELAFAALLVQLSLGFALGISAAAFRGTIVDETASSIALIHLSAPTFVVGLSLQYLLAYKLRLLPLDGYGTGITDHVCSLLLPALSLGISGSGFFARLVRDELTGMMRQDFLRTVRAKGASEVRVLVIHGLRNALLPVATMAALELGTLVGGAVVTEKLFRWPGIGQLSVDALLNRDAPVVFGVVLFTSTAVVLSTLAMDAIAALLDPRLR